MFDATYFDETTAAARKASCTLTSSELLVHCEDGPTVSWPRDRVRLVEAGDETSGLHLRNGWDHADRLLIDHPEAKTWLLHNLPEAENRDSPSEHGGRKLALWVTVMLLSVALLLVVIIPYTSSFVAQRLPEELNQKIGLTAKRQILGVFSAMEDGTPPEELFCRDEQAEKIIATLANSLSAGLDMKDPLTIDVIDLNRSNALALPGGHILVFRGLFDDLESGNEFAGVLAHEIAHAALNHPMEVFIKNTGASVLIGFLIGDIAGGSVLAGIGNILIGSAYSREAEEAADKMAIRAMNGRGWDISPLARFFDRIDEKQGTLEAYFAFAATHPVSKERAEHIRTGAQGTLAAMTQEQWAKLKTICAE